MAHTLTVTAYWSPRQLDDHQALSNHDGALSGTSGSFYIQGISDIGDTGVADTAEFFSVANAYHGSGNSEPEWQLTGSLFEWLNQDVPPDKLPVNVIGRTQYGAGTNTALKGLLIPSTPYSTSAVYLSEIEHITSTDPYTVPAGDWTARLYVNAANAGLFIHSVIVMKVGWYQTPSGVVFGGPGTSVIYTHTETAPFTVLGTIGAYSVNFTTTSDQVIDPRPQATGGAAEKLVVMMVIGNSTINQQGLQFRHNQIIETPIPYQRVISLDPATVTLSPQPVTISAGPISKSVGVVAVSTAAQPVSVTIGTLLLRPDAASVAIDTNLITVEISRIVQVGRVAVGITVLPLQSTPVTAEPVFEAPAFLVKQADTPRGQVTAPQTRHTASSSNAVRARIVQAHTVSRPATSSCRFELTQAQSVGSARSGGTPWSKRVAGASLGGITVACSRVARSRTTTPQIIASTASGGPRRTT